MRLFRAGLCLAVAVVVFAGSVEAAIYQVDGAHSYVGFSVKHMFSPVRGAFKRFDGTFDFDVSTKVIKNVDFKIKVDSIDTANGDRDKHLKGPDFFDAATFPEISFVATLVKPLKKDLYKIEGLLTMHGVTKPVIFQGQYLGAGKNPWGIQIASFMASATINRKDFGINWNKALDNGGVVVGEDVTLTVEIEAVQKLQQPK